jgi:hypothetical protein
MTEKSNIGAPPHKFKTAAIARRSNIPFLGRTRFMANLQQKATQLAPSTNFPLLSAFTPWNLWPWVWSYVKDMFHGKYKPYPTYASDGQDGVYPLTAADGGNTVRISIVGDWGTGTREAYDVGQLVQNKYAPDYTIHLGDVYYVGDDPEVQENFLGNSIGGQYTPVSWPTGKVGTFAMLGNHEMYGGGKPYFTEVLSYCKVGGGQAQKASFFCLETPQWRILAIDTGYNSVGTPILGSIPIIKKIPFLGANCKLEDDLIEWLRTNVQPQQKMKPTVVLSHHQYFSAFDDGDFPIPAKQLNEFFPDQEVVWIWGHEHRLAVYQLSQPGSQIKCYGRCVGHGGMPVECATPKAHNPPVTFYDCRCDHPIGDGQCAGWNGFVNLTLNGYTLTLDYRDFTDHQLFVESFVGDSDGGLQYSFQTDPAPILVPPGIALKKC